MTPTEVYKMLYDASMIAQKLLYERVGTKASNRANIHAVKNTWTTYSMILQELKH